MSTYRELILSLAPELKDELERVTDMQDRLDEECTPEYSNPPEALNCAFIWAGTPQGDDFWQEEYTKIFSRWNAQQQEKIGAEEYLGDAVYASFDGYQIWLKTRDGISTTNQIALEPGVFKALSTYAKRIWGVKAE